MSEKRRRTSSSAVRVENRRKKINIEEKLDVIRGLGNGRGIFMVTQCINDIKHFYCPTNEHNIKKRRVIKTSFILRMF